MTDSTYSLRANWWGPETTYRQDDRALHWSSRRGQGSVPYSAIRRVQITKFRYFGARTSYWRCVLQLAGGGKIKLQAAHVAGFRRIEDRSAAYIPFIKQLEARIAAANPASVIAGGSHWIAMLDAVRARAMVLLFDIAGLLPLAWVRAIGAGLARTAGPWLKGHSIAKANLTAAFPEKSPREIDHILTGMWDNIGRQATEYAHLHRIWDYDPDRPETARHIVLDDATRQRLDRLRRAKGPHLLFSAHYGNWELLSWSCGLYQGEKGIVYRPSRIGPIDRKLFAIRSRSGVSLIAASADAVITMRQMLQRGGIIGMLVDEHFSRGVEVTFFGRPCTVTPMLARYARQLDCPIHGARLIRLTDGRFRLDLTDELPLPRDGGGKVDIAAAMQQVTTTIEGWIRERPEQWLWIQRRWR
jgi:KDO2-lipid IV(A) lauroyltransferase